MFVIGLTGGIGTGKSKASEILRDLGAKVIAADAIGHETYLRGTETWRELVGEFGEEILETGGEVNRDKLGQLVFGNKQVLEKLNSIVHPRIRSEATKRLRTLSECGTAVAVIEAALLLEAGWEDLVDEIWVMAAPEETIVQRLRNRDRLNTCQIQLRISSQMTEEERLASADVIIDSSHGIAQMRMQLQAFWRERVINRQET